jgi:hypothetical protein
VRLALGGDHADLELADGDSAVRPVRVRVHPGARLQHQNLLRLVERPDAREGRVEVAHHGLGAQAQHAARLRFLREREADVRAEHRGARTIRQRLLVALAPRDVLKVDREAVGRRVRADVQPAIERRVEQLEVDGHLLGHGTVVLLVSLRADQIGQLFPDVLPDQIAGVALHARDQLRGLPVDVGDPPLVVEGDEAVGDAVEDVRAALGRPAQLFFGPLLL